MPAARSSMKNKTNLSVAETRDRAKAALENLNKKKDDEETKQNIAKLVAALEKGDDEFESKQLNEEMDTMEIDEEDGTENAEKEKADKEKADKEKADKEKADKEKADKEKADKEKADKEKADKEKADTEKADREKAESEKKRKRTTVEDEAVDSEAESKGNSKFTFKHELKRERRESDSPLFVPEEGSESELEEVDPEYGRPLFSRPGPKAGDDVKTVGWAGGRRNQYINRYGPKNAAKHRLEAFADSAQYEDLRPEPEKVSNPNNRYGDKKLPNGNLQFTKRHIVALYGVAWEGAGTGDSEADLALIDPEQVEVDGRKWPTTYIFIAWDVNGTTEKRWEPRQTLRARWGKKVADKAVFKAACEAEDRYSEVLSGKRRATSRSPSVGLVDDTARQFREKSLGTSRTSPRPSSPTRPSPSRSKRTTPDPPTRSSKSKVDDATKAQWAKRLDDFRADYCECSGVSSFQELDPADKADFMKTWKHAKAEWVEAA